RRFQRASYRSVLERGEEGFRSAHAIDPQDYVLAGGGFPLRVSNAGIIGCLTVSGLPQRQDHEVGVEALCQHLGLNFQDYALALEQPQMKLEFRLLDVFTQERLKGNQLAVVLKADG